jgi:hypothetical protein
LFLASDADRMQRFTRQAKAASALNHPNVATVHDIGETSGVQALERVRHIRAAVNRPPALEVDCERAARAENAVPVTSARLEYASARR